MFFYHKAMFGYYFPIEHVALDQYKFQQQFGNRPKITEIFYLLESPHTRIQHKAPDMFKALRITQS